MWTLIATSIIIVSLIVMVRSTWRFANYLLGFDGFGGEWNGYIFAASWTWVGIFYLAWTYLF